MDNQPTRTDNTKSVYSYDENEDYLSYERRKDILQDKLAQQQLPEELREPGEQSGAEASKEDNSSERIEKHLRLLVLALLRRDENMHAKVVEKYYASNAEVINPVLGIRRGHQEILSMYQLYSRILRHISVHVNRITISNDQNTAMIDLTQHIQLAFFPIVNTQFHMYMDLTLCDTTDGEGKLISRQVDVYTVDGVLRAVPIVRYLYALYLLLATFLFMPVLVAIVSVFNSVMTHVDDLKFIADTAPTRIHEHDYSVFS